MAESPAARGRARGVLAAAGALALSLIVTSAALAAGGYSPAVAGAALLRGALGSPDAILSVTLVRAVPLILTGLAVTLAFRAGVWNIGAEGQLYAGAVCATVAGLAGAGLPAVLLLPLLLIASALGGALWALGPAWLRARLGVGEVITTLLLNFVAIDLASWAVHGPLQESRRVFPQSDPIAVGARLPLLWVGTRLHWGFVLAVALAGALWWVLARTVAGFRIRAVGGSPSAARVAGRIAVGPVTLGTFLASGALAGLAGGAQVSGVTYAMYEGLSPGHGYTAIAVALLAGLNPLAVVPTGILFGGLEGGAGAMQRFAGVPAAWVRGVEALVILSVLALDRGVRRAGERGADVDAFGPFLEAAVRLGIPLALAALGETITERSGVINIGLEGSIIAGALASALGALAWGAGAGVGAGAVAGLAVAAVFALFALGLRADQIITGTAVTMGGLGFTAAAYESRFGATGTALTLPTLAPMAIPGLSRLPLVGPAFFEQAPTAYLAYALAPLLWLYLHRTAWGLELRAAGEEPLAAEAAGVRVVRTRVLATLFGGLLGGVAGAHLALAHTGTFSEGMSAGRGFIAIAVVVLGRWHPIGVLAAALLFGAASALQFFLQTLGLDVPYQLFLALPYLLTLLALAGWVGRARAPAALGRPWPEDP